MIKASRNFSERLSEMKTDDVTWVLLARQPRINNSDPGYILNGDLGQILPYPATFFFLENKRQTFNKIKSFMPSLNVRQSRSHLSSNVFTTEVRRKRHRGLSIAIPTPKWSGSQWLQIFHVFTMQNVVGRHGCLLEKKTPRSYPRPTTIVLFKISIWCMYTLIWGALLKGKDSFKKQHYLYRLNKNPENYFHLSIR